MEKRIEKIYAARRYCCGGKAYKEKGLSREDLTLIFSSLDINHKAFPEILKSREAAQETRRLRK